MSDQRKTKARKLIPPTTERPAHLKPWRPIPHEASGYAAYEDKVTIQSGRYEGAGGHVPAPPKSRCIDGTRKRHLGYMPDKNAKLRTHTRVTMNDGRWDK